VRHADQLPEGGATFEQINCSSSVEVAGKSVVLVKRARLAAYVRLELNAHPCAASCPHDGALRQIPGGRVGRGGRAVANIPTFPGILTVQTV
jgi:hypothetical protein